MRVAVVGSGISGLSAAWLMSRDHDVVLYEADERIGGHSNTATVDYDGVEIPVDTGFIVYNVATYPNLIALFKELGVPTEKSDMAFSVSVADGAFEYEGSLTGLIAQPGNWLDPGFRGMLLDVLKFFRTVGALIDRNEDISIEDWLRREGYGDRFIFDHLLPMAAAIWSCPVETMKAFPAASFLRFFHNHGLLKLMNRPQWRTVSGGSRSYVSRIADILGDRIRRATPVVSIRRTETDATVTDAAGNEATYDQVIIAAHADQALAMLADPSDDERRLLGAVGYQENVAVLHRDHALMPKRRGTWASWNYMSDGSRDWDQRVSLTYWMNRLQNIDHQFPLFVSLNPFVEPDPDLTFGRFEYTHPVFDSAAVSAQQQLPAIQGQRRTWYCGSYCGYGFHEDGLKSAVAVARALGAPPPWQSDVPAADERSFLGGGVPVLAPAGE